MHDDFVSVNDVNAKKQSDWVVALRRVRVHLFLSNHHSEFNSCSHVASRNMLQCQSQHYIQWHRYLTAIIHCLWTNYAGRKQDAPSPCGHQSTDNHPLWLNEWMNAWMNTCIYIAPVKQKSSEALAAEYRSFEFFASFYSEATAQGCQKGQETVRLRSRPDAIKPKILAQLLA